MSSASSPTKLLSSVGLLVLLTMGSAFVVRWVNPAPEVEIAILTILGVLVLVAVLAAIAVYFQGIGLSDPKQALGLPEGSVRALLAIGLLLIVSIIVLFLYVDIGNDRGIQSITVPAKQQDTVIHSLPPGSVLGTPNPVPNSNDVSIQYAETEPPAAIDIAKQLVTLFGTLLASVVAFYFGSSTAISAQAKQQPVGTPAIEAVTPQQITAGQDTAVVIGGTSLDLVDSVYAISATGDKIKSSSEPRSNATSIGCTFNISTPGKYSLQVSDKSGRTASLKEALVVVTSPRSGTLAGVLAIQAVSPSQISSGLETPITINGSDLGQVTTVEAIPVSSGASTVKGTSVAPAASSVTTDLMISQTGKYTLQVTDSSGRTATLPESLEVK